MKLTRLAYLCALVALTIQGFSQPRFAAEEVSSAGPSEIDALVETSASDQQVGSLELETEDREEVRAFFHAVYRASENVPIEWTGDYEATANAKTAAGDTADAFKAATLVRVNYYRAMTGIPADIVFIDELNEAAQLAALIMAGNDGLSHYPKKSEFDNYITDLGDTTAGDSNLAIGSYGPDSIDGYMQDHGANNAAAGHRRWLLFPSSTQMGTGDVPEGPAPATVVANIEARRGFGPQNDRLRRANAIHVFSSVNFGAQPSTTFPFVAYPQKGYIPYQLVFPRWSFSIRGANFSNATVSMTRNGTPIAISKEPLEQNIGNETLVWVYDNKNADEAQSHGRPTQDTVYRVTISGITNAPQSTYTYDVVVIDPDVESNNYAASTFMGPENPLTQENNEYNVTSMGLSMESGVRYRSFDLTSATVREGAESLAGFKIFTSGGYDVKFQGSSQFIASGTHSFHLATSVLSTQQTLELPQSVLIGEASQLRFKSMLRLATTTQFAQVQVSLDAGTSWRTVFSQQGKTSQGSGSGSPDESSFTQKSLDLSPFTGRTLRVRFAYLHIGEAAFPQTDTRGGWFFDDIAIENVQLLSNIAIGETQAGTKFVFSPQQEGEYHLQAQTILLGKFPHEWGSVKRVTAIPGGSLAPQANDDAVALHAGSFAAKGNVLANDTDANPGDILTVRAVNGKATNVGTSSVLQYGRLAVLADGSFHYKLDNSLPAVRQLQEGQKLSETISYQIADLDGSISEAAMIVTISGSGEPIDQTPPSRLVNVATRGIVRTGDSIMIPGFVIGGEDPMDLLVRAVGPTLSQFNLSNLLSNPILEIYRSGETAPFAFNDDWEGSEELANKADLVGAFPLPTDSTDAAVALSLSPGRYTAGVRDADTGEGIALVEVYDSSFQSDPGVSTRFDNISTRGFVGTGDDILIPGFAVEGSRKIRLLIRGVGPSLAGLEVPNLLVDPKIRLATSPKGVFIAGNDDWSSGSETAKLINLASYVGAFDLIADSKDASLIVELDPGRYTVAVSGADGGSGNAIAEVYVVRD